MGFCSFVLVLASCQKTALWWRMNFWVAILKEGTGETRAFRFVSDSRGVQCRSVHLWEQLPGRWPFAPCILRCCPGFLTEIQKSDIQRTKGSFRLYYWFPLQPWEVPSLQPMSATVTWEIYSFPNGEGGRTELISLWNRVEKKKQVRGTLSEKEYRVATSLKKLMP